MQKLLEIRLKDEYAVEYEHMQHRLEQMHIQEGNMTQVQYEYM